MKKPFEIQDVECLKRLVGARLCDIWYAPAAGLFCSCDVFYMDFYRNEYIEDKPDYILAVFASLRVCDNTKIYLTSADVFFNENFEKLTPKETRRMKNFEGSLVKKRCKEVCALLDGVTIQDVTTTPKGDFMIKFANGISMEVVIDCCGEGEIYYWFADRSIADHHVSIEFEKGAVITSDAKDKQEFDTYDEKVAFMAKQRAKKKSK